MTVSERNSLCTAYFTVLTGFILCTLVFNVVAGTYEEGKQAYLNKDYSRALEILQPLAENGNSQAQITMGLMYDYGHGVPRDAAESVRWHRLAAEQGASMVQHDLGVKYFQGQGVDQNYQEAAKWWQMSASAGIADSQFNLGLMYYRGIGLDKDFVKARNLFEAAAKQGHGGAQYSLAVMYAFGQGTKKDYKTALFWFQKSADQDVAQAQFNMGVFYENGYGLEKNPEKAIEWYALAANQGLQEAIEKLRTFKVDNAAVSQSSEAVSATTPSLSVPIASATQSLDLRDWIRQQAADNYTLQLGSVVNEQDIIDYINASGLGASAGYIKVIVNGVTRYSAIYGIYDSYEKAADAIIELPLAVQNSKPWVRNTGILQGLLL